MCGLGSSLETARCAALVLARETTCDPAVALFVVVVVLEVAVAIVHEREVLAARVCSALVTAVTGIGCMDLLDVFLAAGATEVLALFKAAGLSLLHREVVAMPVGVISRSLVIWLAVDPGGKAVGEVSAVDLRFHEEPPVGAA